ncbi:MAG: glutamate racemase [Oscillospiraceae bacterium]|jgi:glutamate racemase|nr:glutamate racemase [Oscillospiraceae bacterium]
MSLIGVFDSGLGGLTAVRRLLELLPREDILYLGDTARVPYGSRSRDTIRKYAREDAHFLLSHSVDAIMVACNTVSSSALGDVREVSGTVPVFDVVEPPAIRAARVTQNGKIAVLGTAATVRSGAYERELGNLDRFDVISVACPLFVPLAEAGRVDANDVAVRAIASDYLQAVRDFGADTVILGCTHYPLLRDAIGAILGDGVTLIDSGAVAAEDVAAILGLHGADAELGTVRFCVTDDPESFRDNASLFLGREIDGVEQVRLG